MSTRTDVHSPTNLVTEDYEFAYAYDSQEPGKQSRILLNLLIDDGWTFGENHSAGDCYHCGARLRYVAVLKHIPTHSLVKVGETCLDNRFELASVEFHALRKQAQLDREKQRIKARRVEWLAESTDNGDAVRYAEDNQANDFYFRFLRHVERYGDASDRFVAAILRSKVRDEEHAAKRAAEAAEPTSPVIEGKAVLIRGEVVTMKMQDGYYGSTLKMLVKDERGFKVWGTVPSSPQIERGDRIEFLAGVEKSDDDETFGYFKRPRKTTVLAAS